MVPPALPRSSRQNKVTGGTIGAGGRICASLRLLMLLLCLCLLLFLLFKPFLSFLPFLPFQLAEMAR